MTYAEWIADYHARTPYLLGRCHEATAEMKEAFPELTIVRGHVYTSWGKRGHLWLTSPDGSIVDPTAAQFEALFEYEPWEPGDEVRVGKCMNCGEEIWRAVDTLDVEAPRESVCGEECEWALRAELAE